MLPLLCPGPANNRSIMEGFKVQQKGWMLRCTGQRIPGQSDTGIPSSPINWEGWKQPWDTLPEQQGFNSISVPVFGEGSIPSEELPLQMTGTIFIQQKMCIDRKSVV